MKLIAVAVGLAVLVGVWIADPSTTIVTLITVVWVIGLFGWVWVGAKRQEREGHISNLDNSAYTYSWRDRSPTIGTPGGYRYADDDYDSGDSGDSGDKATKQP